MISSFLVLIREWLPLMSHQSNRPEDIKSDCRPPMCVQAHSLTNDIEHLIDERCNTIEGKNQDESILYASLP
jgi:hypothetical protein